MATSAISGVVTTGIYCREGCPGRPKRRNVVDFRVPVAAEAAGFRACYRCRPDRLPPPSELEGAPPIVERALLAINEGALDAANEEELARRLSVSGRHLRRLFLQYIGATPDFVARSRRAHFARRLLDETDLSVAHVTFAAGFASVRQMNRIMLETFRASPSELRARRLKLDRLVADGGLQLRIPYAQPYDFQSMLQYLKPRAIRGVESVDMSTYRRTMSTCGNPGALEVSDAHDGRHLLLRAHLPTFDALIDDVARVRRLFGLDCPSIASMQAVFMDPLLAPLVSRGPGLRVPGAWDRFEVAVRIIIGQGVSVPAASTLAGRLAAKFGRPVAGLEALDLTRIFPAAEDLAGAGREQLASVGIPMQRVDAIRGFAAAYADGDIELDAVTSLDGVVTRLQSLAGIGPWTANMIALRAAAQLDAFPSEDLGLRRAFARLSGSSTLPASRSLHERAEAWRPYRGVAATYLWRHS